MNKNKKLKHDQSEVKKPSKAVPAVNPGNTNDQSGIERQSKNTKAVSGDNWIYYIALAIILLLSLNIYLPTLKNGFVYDDSIYIINNNLIKNLSWKDIGAIFSDFSWDNYCPVTFLIHSVVFKISGYNPITFHFTNLIFHLFNTALVFWFIKMLCDRRDVAAITAFLFGIHPLGVETVAWISAGTNIHAAAFFLSSLIAYLYYLQQGHKRFLLISLFFFILSLLSKTVVVVLPVILLLVDYYKGRKITIKILLEKSPFLVLAVATGIITLLLKYNSFNASKLIEFSFPQRIIIASYGFITYLWKLILPVNLSAFYPYPLKNIPYHYYIFPVLIIGLAAYVIYSIKFTKKIIFGIGFFAINVFLVLQILPVGMAMMADRYSYIPSIGIFYLAGEGLIYIYIYRTKKIKWPVIAILSIAGILYSVKTYSRCGVWKNEKIFWNDVIDQYQTIYVAYYNRGIVYTNEKKFDEAIKDFNKAIELNPNYAAAYDNRGNVFLFEYKMDEAVSNFNKAIELRPDFPDPYVSRGLVYMNEKNYDEAMKDFNKAIELKSDCIPAYVNRGIILAREKRFDEAIKDMSKVIELKPEYSIAWYNRGMFENDSGNKIAACTDLKKAASLGHKMAAQALSRICK